MKYIRRILLAIIVCSVVLTLNVSCSEKPAVQVSETQKQDVPPAGVDKKQLISYQYAIYYLPSPEKDPLTVLRDLLSKEVAPPVLLTEVPEEPPNKPILHCYLYRDVQSNYTPPDMGALQYFGRGINREQAEQLQKSRVAFIMNFAHDKEHMLMGLKTANRIAESLARETNGLLWDEETREVFTSEEWYRSRIEGWTTEFPDVSNQITIHAYKSDEYVRAITLGMSKFGLPDVIVKDFSWSLNRTMGLLISLFSQAMAEGAIIDSLGEFDLDIREIRNKDVREIQMESLIPNATAVALLTLKEGTWEAGDPDNRLIEIDFDRYPGRDVHARQEKMLSTLFGWKDDIVKVNHDEELLAASQDAKAKLPSLRREFNEGLDPGEFIQVKAPFKTPNGGNEWMWVEVSAWEGSNIKGLLKNEPYNIPSLHGGQIVNVKQEDVFDYIRVFSDGMQEGNETGAIIQKLQ